MSDTKKVIIGKELKKRKNIVSFDNNINNSNNNLYLSQNNMINKLYMDEDFQEKKFIISEIKKKINGYKSQDKKKEKLSNNFISYDETIEKLVESKLKCYYCIKDVYIYYENIREPNQWTLDRLDNNNGHNKDNIVICCLDCNLKRRVKNHEKFKFTKQLTINKTS